MTIFMRAGSKQQAMAKPQDDMANINHLKFGGLKDFVALIYPN